MKISELRSFIKETIKQIKENQPATAPTKPTIAPSKPGTDKPKPRRPLGNPNVQPKPKANMSESEQDMINKIVQRYKSKK
jgi:hypothetical protein